VPEPARRLRRLGGYERSSRDLRKHTTGKDITAAAPMPNPNGAAEGDTPPDDADDNVTPDPTHCATPGDNGSNKNAAATTPSSPRTVRSNPDADTSAGKNPHGLPLGAGPRAPPPLAVRPPPPATLAVPSAGARESIDDNAAIARDDNAGPPYSNARSGLPDDDANAAPPGDTTRCNNDSGDGWDGRTVRSL
jgi:hypothetical protein